MRIISITKLRDETFHRTFLTERPTNLADLILWCFDCQREHLWFEVDRIDLQKDLDYQRIDDPWQALQEQALYEINDATFHELSERLNGTNVAICMPVHSLRFEIVDGKARAYEVPIDSDDGE